MICIVVICSSLLVALSSASGFCQEQISVNPQVATVSVAKIQTQSLLKAKLDRDLHTLADQLDAKYKQQIQNPSMTVSEQKLLGKQFQAQVDQLGTQDSATFTQAVKDAIATVAKTRGFALVLTNNAANFSDKNQQAVTVYNTASLSINELAHTGIDITNDVVQQLNQQATLDKQLGNVVSSVSNSSPSPIGINNIVFHEEDLNQAFRLTAEQLNQAIDKGKQLAQQGKKWDDVYKSVAQMPRGVKGEKGKSHESVVYCTTLNAVDLTASAYKAANNYDPLPPRHSENGYAKQVHFFVSLESDPKVSATDSGRNRTADSDDVDVTKFVLTDDKDNIINPIDINSVDGVETGTIHFWGTRPSQRVTTSERETSTGIYTTTRTRTSHVRWSVRHPYYSASYNVVFPLFDADGQPLIKTDTKSITLHIITPNGEKQVTYDLNPPKI